MGKRFLEKGCMVWLVVFGVGLWSTAVAQEKKVLEVKAASVNGSIITMKQLDRELTQIQQRLAGQGKTLTDSELAAIKKDLLESLINRELIYQESRRQKISAKESEVAEQFDGLKKRFPGETEFNQALQQMNISETEIKKQIRQELELKAFIDQNYSRKISIPEPEVRAYYDSHPDFFKQPEKVRASHILIKVDPQADNSQKGEARQQLEQIQQKLDAGEDFGALAKAFSQGPSSSRNGDLGYFGHGQMVKPFEDAAFALKPGEVSGIVETNFGYHLIKIFDKKPEAMAAFDQAKGKIEQHLKQDKIRKEIGELIEKLKQKADVKKYL
ncbi:MAG: peptidylprolyl isomerase [Desulfobacterales bacterium]|nr:peptidylprolyl isomerase [Desulfobacterales bacterium]